MRLSIVPTYLGDGLSSDAFAPLEHTAIDDGVLAVVKDRGVVQLELAIRDRARIERMTRQVV